MAVPFSSTTRALSAQGARPALIVWGVAGVLLACWAAWFLLGRVTVFQLSQQARLEVQQATHPVAALAGGRVASSRLALGTPVAQGDVLVELDSTAESLRLREEQTRHDGLAGQLAALARELQAREQASVLDAGAGHAALQAAQARLQESSAALGFAADQARRLGEESAAGGVAAVEALQAQAEVRKLAAGREAQIAENRRLQSDFATRAAEQRALAEALRRQQATLQGELSTSEATLARLQLDIERLRVRAPIAGRVAEVAPLRPGDVVAAGQKFATLVPAGDFIVAAEFEPSGALGRVHAGQPARLRLTGFAWAQYGSIEATVSRVAGELRDGRLRVELAPRGALPPGLVLQHGLPGAVEIEIESVAPAVLLLRASGQLLAGAS